MRIGIVSDTHFGFRWGSEREDDCFENAREAFERTRDCDVVILPGDIYDKKVPKQEVLDQSVECFNVFRQGTCDVDVSGDVPEGFAFSGTPVVAIHGTHERRTKGFTNPVELLETMGYALHLHRETVVFEKSSSSGERVAVHGMSGVPERYAARVLADWGPEPVEDAYNILVFHQSVEGFVYTEGDVLTLGDLPEGFDLLVDGHIHWYDVSHTDDQKPILLPGSTVSTQMRKVEAEKPKGYVTVDTETDEVAFHALESPRDLFYEEIDAEGRSSAAIMEAVDKRMEEILSTDPEKKPLVRIVVRGESDASLSPREIRDRYGDRAILSVGTSLDRETVDASRSSVSTSQQSVAEMGREMLRERVGGGKQVDDLFDLLAAEDVEAAVDAMETLDLDAVEAENGDGEDGNTDGDGRDRDGNDGETQEEGGGAGGSGEGDVGGEDDGGRRDGERDEGAARLDAFTG